MAGVPEHDPSKVDSGSRATHSMRTASGRDWLGSLKRRLTQALGRKPGGAVIEQAGRDAADAATQADAASAQGTPVKLQQRTAD